MAATTEQPVKYWLYASPAGNSNHAVWTIMSEEAILAEYGPYWSKRMLLKHGKMIKEINKENCIQDWVTTHWAEPCTLEKLQQICMKN